MADFTCGQVIYPGIREKFLTDFKFSPLDLDPIEFIFFFKLDKSSIKANMKLACQYRVKQFSVIHGCINLRIFLIELSFLRSCFPHVTSTHLSPEFPLDFISTLIGTDVHLAE